MDNQDWEIKKEISIADMQDIVEKLRDAKTAYQSAKATSDAAYEVYKDLEGQVISLLQDAGQKEFTVTGVGRVSISDQLSVKTPKTPEEKQKFFDWVKENLGEDGYWAYTSVNSQSLNSLYKTMSAEYAAKGEVLEIDGLEPATSYTKLSFTKK